jgi:retron-type reverse transcriptase
MRKPGIPAVRDKIIQQAIAQVLSSIYERQFFGRSYGYRSGRSAQKALRQASDYVTEGREVVVDMDLKGFFDEANHDCLMYELPTKVGDKPLLKLRRKYNE